MQGNTEFPGELYRSGPEKEVFPITLTLTGRRSAPVLTFSGQEARELSAVIYSSHPDVSQIVWSSEDPDLVTVTRNGTVARYCWTKIMNRRLCGLEIC